MLIRVIRVFATIRAIRVFDVRVGQFLDGFGFKDTNGLRHEFHEFTLVGSAVFVIIRGIRVEPSCTSCLRANHSNQITQLVFDISGSRNGMGNFLAQ